MAYKKRSQPRKNYKKRYVRKTKRYARKRKILNNPIPRSMIMRFKNTHQFSLDAGLGTIDSQVFNICSITPFGSGRQPPAFDQFIQMYQYCTVIGYRVRATFAPANLASAGGNSINCTLALLDTAIPFTNIGDYITYRNTTTRVLMNNGAAGTANLYHKSNPWKFLGIPDPLDNPAENSNTVSTGPTAARCAHLHVACEAINASVNPSPVYVQLMLEQIVVFTRPVDIVDT